MKELRDILAELDRLNSPVVLATVVDVKGSSYRLPGARMLVLDDGRFVGTVSGGCIEADVLERSARVAQSGRPEIFLYDTTRDENSVFSMNMGCKGIVRILLERVEKGSPYTEFLKRSQIEGNAGFIATRLIEGDGAEQPARAYFDGAGDVIEGEPAACIKEFVRGAAPAPMGRRPAEIVSDEETGAEYFVEFTGPPQHLLVLGAGADAMPLVDLAHRIGWRTTVADHRPAYCTKDRFPSADEVIVCRPEKMIEAVAPGPGTAAVIMSHNFGHDKEYLSALMGSGLAYVGALGPRVRTEELLGLLSKDGIAFSDQQLEVLHAPIGIDTGAADPESIAVSILAEIQAVIAGREGGFLRKRPGPIYDR